MKACLDAKRVEGKKELKRTAFEAVLLFIPLWLKSL
jgi:hypothetical protein